jgi:enoyl-CoA hydratase
VTEVSGPYVRVEVDGGVAVVTLDRPGARNALSTEMRHHLRSIVHELDERPDVHAIVLTGVDPAFCAGVDLKELAAGTPPDLTGPRGAPFLTCSTPLVAAVNGPAYAGGLELVLACHLVVASERAWFADTHATHGMVPGWGLTALLTEAVGPRRARWMLLTSTPVDATTARDWGLVAEVVPHGDVLAAAVRLARRIAQQPSTTRISAVLDAQGADRMAAALVLESAAWEEQAPRGSDAEGTLA